LLVSDGITGDALSEALRLNAAPGEATALCKARALLRAAVGRVAALLITSAGGRYPLDQALVSVDLRDFDGTLTRAPLGR
jgi:hypothetical protein